MTSRRSGKTGGSSGSARGREPDIWCDSEGNEYVFGAYDDNVYYTSSEDDEQFDREASRSKGKLTASMGSSRDTYRRREGSGGGRYAYEDEDEDDSYVGRSSYYQSGRSRYPSSHGYGDYPTARRTRRPDDHLPPSEHHRDSRRQHEPPSASHRRRTHTPSGESSRRRTHTPSGESSRVRLSRYGEYFACHQDSAHPDDGGIDYCHRSSCAVCSERFGPEEIYGSSPPPPPPPYSRHPTSGRPSGGSRARRAVRWADEDEEEEEVIVD